MTDREKLIELMIEAKKADPEEIPFSEFLADFLIAHGVTVQKWIPVTEMLPEDRKWVLVFFGTRQKVLWFVSDIKSVDPYLSRHKKPGFLWHDSEYGYVEVKNVTHWMPLPEPPKEGE